METFNRSFTDFSDDRPLARFKGLPLVSFTENEISSLSARFRRSLVGFNIRGDEPNGKHEALDLLTSSFFGPPQKSRDVTTDPTNGIISSVTDPLTMTVLEGLEDIHNEAFSTHKTDFDPHTIGDEVVFVDPTSNTKLLDPTSNTHAPLHNEVVATARQSHSVSNTGKNVGSKEKCIQIDATTEATSRGSTNNEETSTLESASKPLTRNSRFPREEGSLTNNKDSSIGQLVPMVTSKGFKGPCILLGRPSEPREDGKISRIALPIEYPLDYNWATSLTHNGIIVWI